MITSAAPGRVAPSRWDTLNRFCDVNARRVGTTAAAVWMILFRHGKPDGTSRVSQKRIAKCISRSERRVSEAIRKLEAAGLIETIARGGLNVGPSVVRFLDPTRTPDENVRCRK